MTPELQRWQLMLADHRASLRQATSREVIADLEARARAINGGKNLPRPYPSQNGGSW